MGMRQLPRQVDTAAAGRATRGRELGERLVRLAEHLPAGDRVLLEQAFGRGMGMTELAILTGTSYRRLRRRILRLARRVQSPTYRFLITHGTLLTPEVRRTCEHRVFHGCSLRQTARVTQQSLHTVRRHAVMLDALAGRWGKNF